VPLCLPMYEKQSLFSNTLKVGDSWPGYLRLHPLASASYLFGNTVQDGSWKLDLGLAGSVEGSSSQYNRRLKKEKIMKTKQKIVEDVEAKLKTMLNEMAS
jgi:hypothetical protein